MHAASAAGDFAQVQSIAHDLHGTGGAYGFQPITDIGAMLETSAIAADPDAVRGGLVQLTAYLDTIGTPPAVAA
jgi:HPt (histidine-containing phosphotransfer) domain-containing protein